MLRQTALLFGLVAILGVATAGYGRYSRRRASYGASDGVACPNWKRQCHPDAFCVSEVGRHNYKAQYRCQCKPGYSGNGYSCIDINECVENTHNCDDNANCTNTAGGYTCACKEGFTTCGRCCEAIPPAPSSCKAILVDDPTSQDGVYAIRLENATADIQVYCDMTTAGGGWTLVYSYTFTDHANFKTNGNAVTPHPNWPRHPTTGVSTTTPTALWDTQTGAMDTADWPKIGSEFLIRSNVTNWVACNPRGAASLVSFKPGRIDCTIVNKWRTKKSCVRTIPTKLQRKGNSYALLTFRGRSFTEAYFWDTSTTRDHPAHRPCWFGFTYEPINGVPGGAILLR